MANKRQRKKRMKKLAQMKIVKQGLSHTAIPPVVHMTFREIEDIRVKEQTDLHMAKENEKLQRTALYQQQLDAVYGGTVTPIEKYLNPHSSILHVCHDCKKEWYSRPVWLLTKENQRHICGVDVVNMSEKTKKKHRKLTENDKMKMYIMAEQGLSMTKIANRFGISRPTVISHLRKAGLL